jgi:hypothetical protein
MRNRKRLLLGLILVVALAFSVAWVGIPDKNDQHILGTWTFENTPTFSDDITVSDDATITDDASIGGDLSVTGSVTIGDELVHKLVTDSTYNSGIATGANVDILTTNGDIFVVAGSTGMTIRLPAITSAMNGWVWTYISQASTATTLTSTQPTVDAMETSLGSIDTDGSYGVTWADTAGEVTQWVARYVSSGSSSVWLLVSATTVD